MSDPATWTNIDDAEFLTMVGPLQRNHVGGGTGRFRFLAEPKHRNRNGVVQGGMLMTFADRSLGMTAAQDRPGRRQATVQLDMHFVSAAPIGRHIEMDCKVVRETRNLVFVEGTLHSGGRVVATAKGLWAILVAGDEPPVPGGITPAG